MPVKLYFAKFLYLFGVSQTKYSLLMFLVKWAKYIPICRSVLNRSLALDFIQTGIKKNHFTYKGHKTSSCKNSLLQFTAAFPGIHTDAITAVTNTGYELGVDHSLRGVQWFNIKVLNDRNLFLTFLLKNDERNNGETMGEKNLKYPLVFLA